MIQFNFFTSHEKNSSKKFCEYHNESKHYSGESGKKVYHQKECSHSAWDFNSNKRYSELNKITPPRISPPLNNVPHQERQP